MQVDFYQLAGTPPEQVIASIAEKVLDADGRLLVVAEDELFLARLNRMLWNGKPVAPNTGKPTSSSRPSPSKSAASMSA